MPTNNGKPWIASQNLQSPTGEPTGLRTVTGLRKSTSRANELGVLDLAPPRRESTWPPLATVVCVAGGAVLLAIAIGVGKLLLAVLP